MAEREVGRGACSSKTTPISKYCGWAGASVWEVSPAISLAWFNCTVIFYRVEHDAIFWSLYTFFNIKNAARCHLWLGAEKGRREQLSCSSLEGIFGTVVSCGCNYECDSGSLVLGKGSSDRYIMVEVLRFFSLPFVGFLFCFFSAWSADLELFPPGISTWRLFCFLLHILYEKHNFFFYYSF